MQRSLQRSILQAYRRYVRKKLLARELGWWKKSMIGLDSQLLLPYEKTKPFPAPFDQAPHRSRTLFSLLDICPLATAHCVPASA